MNKTLLGYLKLTRPANLPTAAADALAGMVIAGIVTKVGNTFSWNPDFLLESICLVLASVLLYAGGVVLNDVFDYKLDKVERPERTIPSGVVPLKSAAIFGALLMSLGIGIAFYAHFLSGITALILTLAIVLYDGYSKKSDFLGPLNMGVCRGLNLLMGISIFGVLVHWEYTVIPIVYIAAITLISRGEVHGDNKSHIVFSALLYALVLAAVCFFHYNNDGNTLEAIPFILIFGILIYKPLFSAYQDNSPKNIKKAVISGVLSIVLLDAAIAVGFSNWMVGLGIVLLLPLSILLSKLFAVT